MEIKDVSYSTVLSHVFPGVVLELQILLAFSLFSPIPMLSKIAVFVQANVTSLLSFGILFFVMATILGFILDGMHHFFLRNLEQDIFGVYKYLNSLEKLEIARSELDADLWYPYEAYANIAIAMIPGLGLLPYWMHIHHFHIVFNGVSMAIYTAVCAIMWHEAVATLKSYKEVEKEVIKAFRGNPPDDHTNNSQPGAK